jgi:hypothetical protein
MEIKAGGRPTAICPAGHTPPAGRHHWLDPYGVWHCTACNPPASLAMVRNEILLPGPGETETAAPNQFEDNFGLPAGFRVIAVHYPNGDVDFTPGITLAERRDALD